MSDEPMTEAQMRALNEEMLDLYNRHDIVGWVEHLTDDAVWTEPTLPEPARGKAAVTEALRDTFSAFPDIRVGDLRLYPDVEDQSSVVTWSVTGTMTGALDNGTPATGMGLRTTGASLIRFRDGRICEYTLYYDSLATMQQLGLLPKSTGLGFKAIVLADVVAVKARKVLQRH